MSLRSNPNRKGIGPCLQPDTRLTSRRFKAAFENGDVALMECQLAVTGEPVAVIAPPTGRPDGEVEFAPFAMMFNGNPYEAINPPKPEGGFFTQDEIWGD